MATDEAPHMVDCQKLKARLPGLSAPPLKGEIGQRIYENISQEAWDLWRAHSTMVINEYRLNPAEPEGQRVLKEQIVKFLFEDGAEAPPDFVPPTEPS